MAYYSIPKLLFQSSLILLLLLQAHWGLRDSTLKEWEGILTQQCKQMGESDSLNSLIYKHVAKSFLKNKPLDLFSQLVPIIILMHSQLAALAACFVLLDSRCGCILAFVNGVLLMLYSLEFGIIQTVVSVILISLMTSVKNEDLKRFMDDNK